MTPSPSGGHSQSARSPVKIRPSNSCLRTRKNGDLGCAGWNTHGTDHPTIGQECSVPSRFCCPVMIYDSPPVHLCVGSCETRVRMKDISFRWRTNL
ncbi:arachidonate 5-lipoxygenase [Anopheles sinensis]|uniref:Arachidonate 5-lipoxygenase n=1 Tax=Anopheles sinensis TaxID=74873 RepID=A0A084V9U2_ANOSI|nr:arachidonate 5-lipoxygenase [Anopheles sinensis]